MHASNRQFFKIAAGLKNNFYTSNQTIFETFKIEPFEIFYMV